MSTGEAMLKPFVASRQDCCQPENEVPEPTWAGVSGKALLGQQPDALFTREEHGRISGNKTRTVLGEVLYPEPGGR